MIYPDWFDDNKTQEKIINLYRQLEDFILSDIANRLLKNSSMTATSDRLIWKLQQLGESREEIMRKLQEITKLSRPVLRALLQDAVMTSWADEKPFYDSLGVAVSNPLENAVVVKIMDAQYRKSLGELSNLTRTTMEQSQKDLMNMLSEYDMRIAFGVQSPTSAVCEILDRYAGKGVEVLYPTGTKRTLEAAVRCCITTSAMQMTGQITAQYIGQYDVDYVCTSAHMGARVAQKGQPPLAGHDTWQGRIFKIKGSEPGCPNLLESTGYDIEVTVDPTTGEKKGVGKTKDMLGLYGYNCKHSAKPCHKDYNNPWRDKDGNLILGGEKVDSEKNRKAYEVSQKARRMERAIRETKRKLLMKEKEINGVAETDVKDILQPEYDKLAYKLRTQNKKYNDFIAENNLKKEIDRTKKSGFGRKQVAKANGAATRYENQQNVMREKKDRSNNVRAVGTVAQDEKSNYNVHRSKEELQKVAQDIKSQIGNYVANDSKWSGNIIVDNSLMKNDILGEKKWNCDIAVVDTVDNGTIWHEMLHSCSASHYKPDVYLAHKWIEEASVEFLTQQICKKIKIITVPSYESYTNILKVLNDNFKYGTDLEFAIDLFNVPLEKRYHWLEERIDQSLQDMKASFEDYNEVMQYVQLLEKGINNE